MQPYAAPLRSMDHVLARIVGMDDLLGRYPDAEPELVSALLEEAGRYIAGEVAPHNLAWDRIGARRTEDGLTMPDGMKAAWDGYRALGLTGITAPPEFGGLGLPHTVFSAVQEMTAAAGLSFVQTPMLNLCAIEALEVHAPEALKRLYLPRMAAGDWTGTMNLTEPQAGSDLGALRTRATRAGDGSYRISGQKVFITSGEHDLAENIVHLVLARLEDAPAGTRGLSLFLVPKFLVGDDGELGPRNDVTCAAIEEKMGLHASATCTMIFGEAGGARGYLIGEEHKGFACMFTMMNSARLHVGLQAVGCAERAFQMAAAFAAERVQGTPLGAEAGAPIRDHADVRRMLMTMRARIAAARAICYRTAKALDMGDDAVADVLTPLAKGYATDIGVEVASDAMQVFGGMGFVEETGIAQIYRDVRITPIYEGTNGIQAWDLANRKLRLAGGAAFDGVVAQIAGFVAEQPRARAMEGAFRALSAAVEAVTATAGWLRDQHDSAPRNAAAGAVPFLRMVSDTVGAWLLLKGAVAAQAEIDSGAKDPFLHAQITLARFHAERLLPLAVAQAAPIQTGDDLVFGADPEMLVA